MESLDAETLPFNGSLWDYYVYQIADPRTTKLFLLNGPYTLLAIIGAYLYFVLSFGPNFMKHREPFQLRKTIILYNLLQIIANSYMFYLSLSEWVTFSNWKCEGIDYSTSPNSKAARAIHGVHFFFLNKISDLLDTVFFVLRKKNSQVSFLHVYHHTIMPLTLWIILRYYLAGGNVVLIGLLNSFVHMCLYMYYFLSGLGPQVQKYLWWKNYITKLQLLQFLIVLYHSVQQFFIECDFPKWFLYIQLPNAVLFLYLFGNFYKKSYIDKKAKNIKTN